MSARPFSPLTTARYLESTQSELDDLVLGIGAAAPTATPATMHPFAIAS